MYRYLLICLVLGAVSCGCRGASSPDVAQKGNNNADKQTAVDGYIVGEPIRHANLTIFPIISKQLKNEDRFITLDEGLKAGTIEILEVGAAQSNRTGEPDGNEPADHENDDPFVENPGDRPASNAIDDPFGGESDDDPFVENPRSLPTGNVANDDPFGDDQETLPGGSSGNRSPVQNEVQISGFSGNLSGISGNDVNRLMVINRSDKPLYLMPGEIIVGGSQDRTIGQELVIQPNKKPVPIDVFCVEHGRWANRGAAQTLGLLSAGIANSTRSASVALRAGEDIEETAKQADKGKFVASVGCLNKRSRLAVQQTGDQSKVWEKVSAENAKSMVGSQSSTFTGNYVEGQSVERLEPYIKKIQQSIAGTERIVGVIVAVNGKVDSLDVFESTPLFKKLWPKLLKSYALDAANASGGKDDAKVCSREDADKFFQEAGEAHVETSEVKDGIALSKRTSDRLLIFSAREEDQVQGAGAMGGFGGVHTSGFSK